MAQCCHTAFCSNIIIVTQSAVDKYFKSPHLLACRKLLFCLGNSEGHSPQRFSVTKYVLEQGTRKRSPNLSFVWQTYRLVLCIGNPFCHQQSHNRFFYSKNTKLCDATLNHHQAQVPRLKITAYYFTYLKTTRASVYGECARKRSMYALN